MNQYREKYESLMRECAASLQGMYGRLYYNQYLPLDDCDKDVVCEQLNEAGVNDMLDFVMYVEG